MTPARRPRIALLAAPATSASVLYGLYDVLLSVGPMYPDMVSADTADALLDVVIVAATAEPFRCFGNILVEPHASVADAGGVDVAIVCDMYTPVHTAPTGQYQAEVAWLTAIHARGGLVASVCTGSLLLAEAGLLDGRTCTGHWAYRDLFRSAYPAVTFSPAPVLELGAERDGIITAGGVTSWQDLALHLIKRYCGPDHAAQTAKVYLLAGHEDGQLPFSAMSRRPSGDAVVSEVVAWIEANLAMPNPVTVMAERSGLTARTFARRFRAATGETPIAYVHQLRIEEARRLLETGSEPVDEVGYHVGYEDPGFFRRLFKRTTGLSPAVYRRKYASVLA